MKNTKEKNRGITLIALVITIIILLVLAGIIISQLIEHGLLSKAKQAKEEENIKTATEIINLKITSIQIASYSETQEMPSLQYLADKLCEDNDIEYVELESKLASVEKIIV